MRSKKKSRWSNEKVEIPLIIPTIPPVLKPGLSAPGIVTSIQLGHGATIKPILPGKFLKLRK